MHSTELRGEDFCLHLRGCRVAHSEFFAGTEATDRLGIVSPTALDALGAAAFVLASVTAFYDVIRRQAADRGEPGFRTYPEFYSLQLQSSKASYSMLDIWPEHKDVAITGAPPALGQAVIDRCIHALLLPDAPSPGEPTDYDDVHLASLRRCIRRVYLYDPTGHVEAADLSVSCPSAPVDEWVSAVSASVEGTPAMVWPDPEQTATTTQSLRRLDIEEGILRLSAFERAE